MANLSDLQRKLNQDPQLRKRFLEQPEAVLDEYGVTLSPIMKAKLQNQLAGVSNVATQDIDLAAVNVGITVGT